MVIVHGNSPPAPPAARHRSSQAKVMRRAAWWGVAPALALITLFVGVAVVQAVYISMTDWRGLGPMDFVGLENYAEVLGTSTTYDALLTTTTYATFSSLGIVAIATLLAAAVGANVRGTAFYRVIWFLPGMAPGAAVAIFWSTAFQPDFGAVNVIARSLGFSGDSALLATASTALIPVIIVTIWAGVGFAFLLILGSVEQIDHAIYEAARVDGAGPIRQFFSITLPLVRPVLIIVALLNFIWAFNGFTIVFAMTRGGPGDATMTLPVLVYQEAFQFSQFGPATALAVLAGVILMVIGIFALRASRSAQQ